MSWDVMVLDYGGNPPSVKEWTDDDRPNLMGKAPEIRAKIDRYLPGVDWSDPTWGVFDGDGFSFEFSINEPLDVGFMVYVRGSGDSVSALLQAATPNGWSLFDTSANDFIDPDNPSTAGWKRWQGFRDQVVEKYRTEEESWSLKRTLSAIWHRLVS